MSYILCHISFSSTTFFHHFASFFFSYIQFFLTPSRLLQNCPERTKIFILIIISYSKFNRSAFLDILSFIISHFRSRSFSLRTCPLSWKLFNAQTGKVMDSEIKLCSFQQAALFRSDSNQQQKSSFLPFERKMPHIVIVLLFWRRNVKIGKKIHMTQLLLLGKFEYTGGPIFKVVLEC